MQVILLQKINKLGNLGDMVNVKPGYARNYLFPQNMAMMATKSNIADLEARRADYEKAAAAHLSEAEQRAFALKDATVIIKARASDEGKLYGSVGPREIAEAITEQFTPVQKSEVLLTDSSFRETGEYEVKLSLHTDVRPSVKIVIEADNS